jgi:hypothetical protein
LHFIVHISIVTAYPSSTEEEASDEEWAIRIRKIVID